MIKPLQDNVVLEIKENENVTASGLIMVEDETSKKSNVATVVAVGPGKINPESGAGSKMPVVVGDVVFFSRYAGTEITVEGKEYLIVGIDDILAVQ